MSEKLEVKIQYLASDIDKITKLDIGDWIDLRAAETLTLKKGESALVPLGVAMVLPEGYEAIVAPRSSTFKKYKVIQTNSFGVIDNSYRGQWMLPVFATEDTVINKNDRVCQFRIIKNQPAFDITEIDNIEDFCTQRGSRGFGSTGVG